MWVGLGAVSVITEIRLLLLTIANWSASKFFIGTSLWCGACVFPFLYFTTFTWVEDSFCS